VGGDVSIVQDQVAQITNTGLATRDELRELGRSLRKEVPRSGHAGWTPPPSRRDPLEILEESNATRLPDLVPVRYGRMMVSPFTYFRGSPAVMAHDLATTPTTTIRPQICGDAHVGNFGIFASPERRLVFDLNDFDETLPGPFDWDVKRLAASIAVAGRDAGFDDGAIREILVDAVRAYADAARRLAELSALDIWYLHADVEDYERQAESSGTPMKGVEKAATKARSNTSLRALDKLTTMVDGRRVIVDDPPLVDHTLETTDHELVRTFFANYRDTVSDDRRHLLERFELVDVARKVVGVGSVGTACYIGYYAGKADGSPLFLQVKEAQSSVLEPFSGRSTFANHGQRAVVGQRLMQATSDLFLGWSKGPAGRDFFVRQLRDMKGGFDVQRLDRADFGRYATVCASVLARAHAKSLDPALVSGYLSSGRTFATAITEFAVAYADQTETDHARLVEAVRDGRVEAIEGR
jgi:uncharacterized protein (DUF2252 family)